MASTNPFYDLVGGYYPGEPIPRKKPPRVDPQKFEFSDAGDIIQEYLNAVTKEVEELGVSAQAKKLFITDLEKALTLQARPQGEYDALRSLELGDEEDIAGAQLKLDVNPYKWIKDPEYMFKKTAKSWFNDIANMSDFTNYLEMNELWDPLLKGEEVNKLAAYGFEEHPVGGISSTFKPFQLMNLGETHNAKYTDKYGNVQEKLDTLGNSVDATASVDLNYQTAGAFKNFVRNAKSSGSRANAFDSFVETAVRATSLDLQEAVIRGDIGDLEDIKLVGRFAAKANVLRLTDDILGKYDTYQYVLSNGSLETGIGTGLVALTEELSKAQFPGADTSKAKQTFEKIFNPKEKDGKPLGSLKILKKKVAEHNAWFLQRDAGGNLVNATPQEYAKFKKFIKPTEDLIYDLGKLEGFDIANSEAARKLNSDIGVIKNKYKKIGIEKGGINRMHENIARELEGTVGDLIRKTKGLNGAKNKIYVLQEVLRQYRVHDLEDLIEQLESKGLLGVAGEIAWNLVRKRLDGYTPASLAKEFMDNMQWFGLVYDPKKGIRVVNGNDVTSTMTRFMESERMGWLFNNKQKVTININGTDVAFAFVGHKSLESALAFFDRIGKTDDSALTMLDLLKIINGDGANKPNDVMEYASDFLSWLKKYGEEHGLRFDASKKLIATGDIGEKNSEILESILKALKKRGSNPSFVSIFQSKVGLFQRLTSLANRLQDNVFKYFKFLAPVSYAKKVAARGASRLIKEEVAKRLATRTATKAAVDAAMKKIAALLTKLVGTVVTVTTDGLGAVVWWVVEKVVIVAINKAIDFSKKVFESVKKVDFSVIDDFVTWAARTMIKTLGLLVGCCTCVALPMIGLFMGILSAITPVDTSRMAQGGGDSFGGNAPNQGVTLTCGPNDGCPVSASAGCYQMVGAEWDLPQNAAYKNIIFNAITYVNGNMGNFVDKVCAAYGNEIRVQWNPSVADCGLASRSGTIYFGNVRCWSYTDTNQLKFNYLLTHETGHLYHWGIGYENIDEVQRGDMGYTLPTYVGGSAPMCSLHMDNNQEDFAEMASQTRVWSASCTGDLAYSSFWYGDPPIPTAYGDLTGNIVLGFRSHYRTSMEVIHAP